MANGLRKLIKDARKSSTDYNPKPCSEESSQLNYEQTTLKKYTPKLRVEELDERITP